MPGREKSSIPYLRLRLHPPKKRSSFNWTQNAGVQVPLRI
jgi:hypothetical protein